MENFTYWVPTKVYNGKGVVRKELGSLAAGLGKKAMIIHYGDGVIEKIGAYEDVTEMCIRDRNTSVFSSPVHRNPSGPAPHSGMPSAGPPPHRTQRS